MNIGTAIKTLRKDKDCILHREGKDVILMQFTGLTDKNGVEIYEGDAIKTERNTVVVFFGKHEFEVQIFGKKDIIEVNGWLVRNLKGQIETLDSSFLKGEIIGNIYEHPLLINS